MSALNTIQTFLPAQAEWLTRKEAAFYLRTSTTTLDRRVIEKKIRRHKPDGRIKFNRHELDMYMRRFG